MAQYSISSKEIHDKYHRTSNATAKAVYKDILRKRSELGSSEAKYYYNRITRSLAGADYVKA